MATRIPPGAPSYDRYELTVENLRAADAERLADRVARAPGIRSVTPDAETNTVELVARDDVAVNDAEWVLDSLGYTVA